MHQRVKYWNPNRHQMKHVKFQDMSIEANIYEWDIKIQLIPIEGIKAKPMSIEDKNKTYTQRLISFKMTDLKTRNEITNSQKRARF